MRKSFIGIGIYLILMVIFFAIQRTQEWTSFWYPFAWVVLVYGFVVMIWIEQAKRSQNSKKKGKRK
jgi:hypothetical protein